MDKIVLIPISLDELRGLINESVREAVNTIPTAETPPQEEEKLLTIKEVCEFFGKSRQTIYDWIHKGYLKYYKISNRTYFLKKDLLEALNGYQLNDRRG